LRRSRKLCLRLEGDPADDQYPDKPARMRWTTYIVAADRIADERLALGIAVPITLLGRADEVIE